MPVHFRTYPKGYCQQVGLSSESIQDSARLARADSSPTSGSKAGWRLSPGFPHLISMSNYNPDRYEVFKRIGCGHLEIPNYWIVGVLRLVDGEGLRIPSYFWQFLLVL